MPSNSYIFFSIIIPTLNEQKFLPHLLSDLSKQTNQDFEVIIVDAKSTDKTVFLAKKFASQLRLKVLVSPQKNVCYQRNYGSKTAQGDWLLFMDADNRLPPYYIQGIRYQVDKNHPAIFTTYISPDGNHRLNKTVAQVFNAAFQTQRNTRRPSILESMIGVYKPAFKRSGGFDESIKWGEGGALIGSFRSKGYAYSVFKEPRYTYSLRRVKKEGTLKIIRNAAPLILAHQTGIKLEDQIVQKLYPMLGGSFFDGSKKPSNTFEQIIKDLDEKYHLTEKVQSSKNPIIKHSGKRFLNFFKPKRQRI